MQHPYSTAFHTSTPAQVLREVFGPELASEVAARYLQEQANGRYRFRQQYARWAAEQGGTGSNSLRITEMVAALQGGRR